MKREGFTLIEVLVVISIIAFLIAVLSPSLQRSKLQAQTLVCNSNVKQLVISLSMYEVENGTFPPAYRFNTDPPPGGYVGNPVYDSTGWWWFHYIADYLTKDSDNNTVLWCPSREINDDLGLKRNVLCANYGVNQSICKKVNNNKTQAEFIGKSLSTCDIQRPSESLLLVDSGYSMINWWHVTNVPPEPLGNSIKDAAYLPGLKINKEKKNLWHGLEWDATTDRHPNNTVNVGFVDGHINRSGTDDLYVEKMETGYKNLYPLWQPIKMYND